MAYTLIVALLSWHLIFPRTTVVTASTHWVVTEDGRIQAQMDSVFNLQRPYDLVALLKQEERAEMLEHLKQELLSKKADIDQNEDQDTGLEQRFYHRDPDCIAAGKPLVEFDLYMSTILPLENKGISVDDYLDDISEASQPYHQPLCTDYVDLGFSMHAFEHLEGVRERRNLSIAPELGLKTVVSFAENIDEYGHLVHVALSKNATSWVLYNMAAFYWRINGDAFQAIECLRRALHYSPRINKDVALVSLSNVLHQARYSNEAAIVIHSAIDVSRELNVNHFTLGNIYAVLAEYNKSVICFENTLLIQPDFEAATLRRYAVLCHAKLEAMLESQHKSLQRTLSELRDYQMKHDIWKQQQAKVNSEQTALSEKIEQRLSYETYKMRLANEGVGELCGLEERGGHHVLQCAWARVKRVLTDYDFLPVTQKNQIATASEKYDSSSATDYMRPVRPPLYSVKQDDVAMDISRLSYMAADWPTKEECDQHAKKFPMWNEFPTTYLSPENKGFDVYPLLGIAQALLPGQQHPFPWYPPVCTTLSDIPEGARSGDHVTSVKERSKLPAKMADANMKSVLLASVRSIEDASKSAREDPIVDEDENSLGRHIVTQDEIGQRILTALKKNIGPKWVLYNLAALYWRVVGNSINGLECARRALYFAPDQYRDIPLLNLANILYRVGRVDDSIVLMKEALTVSDVEPESHFFMGNLLAAISNISGSVHHYREALNRNPVHSEAYASLRIISCYQKFHRTAQSSIPREPASGNSQSDLQLSCGSQANSGETVFVCTKNGDVESCFLTSRHDQCGNQLPVPPLPSCAKQLIPALNNHCMNRQTQRPSCNNQPRRESGQFKEEPISDTLGDNSPGGTTRIEDITDYYRQKGVCTGEECNHFVAQPITGASCNCRQPEPAAIAYERLEVVGGRLIRQVYLEGDIGEIRPHECIIFGNGRRTDGCLREEFQAYVVEKYNQVVMAKSDEYNSVFDIFDSHSQDVAFYFGDDDDLFRTSDGREQFLTFLEAELAKPVRDLEINSIPHVSDPARHVGKRSTILQPETDECTHLLQELNLEHPLTSWISMTTKLQELDNHIDFTVPDADLPTSTPICDTSLLGKYKTVPHLVDEWDTIMMTIGRAYEPELGFTDVLCDFDGLASARTETAEPDIEAVGARLMNALKQNSTSWVLNNLASLYWRVKGHAVHAVSCAMVAYQYSPKHVVDVALSSIASVFYQSGLINEALLVTALALDDVPDSVALHFMMANLYAAQGLLKRAVFFYESTIGLQKSFDPAVLRLAIVLCQLNPGTTGGAARSFKVDGCPTSRTVSSTPESART